VARVTNIVSNFLASPRVLIVNKFEFIIYGIFRPSTNHDPELEVLHSNPRGHRGGKYVVY